MLYTITGFSTARSITPTVFAPGLLRVPRRRAGV